MKEVGHVEGGGSIDAYAGRGARTSAAQQNTTAYTVEELWQQCTSGASTNEIACFYYVSGAANMMFAIGEVIADERGSSNGRALAPFGLCTNQPVSDAQATQQFINWAGRNPKF